MRLVLLAPAKVNLFLEVIRRRPDGYHDLDTVLQTVSLYDRLTIEAAAGPGSIRILCREPGVPTDERNTVHRALAGFFRRAGIRRRVTVRIEKSIPTGGGLGGGSSDAAAALIGLNRLAGRPLARRELAEIAAEVGSDVPFFLEGGLCRARGRGEILRPLRAPPRLRFLLANPGFPVSTAEVYRALGRGVLTGPRRSATLLVRKLRRGKGSGAAPLFFNRLEASAFRLSRGLEAFGSRLERDPGNGAGAGRRRFMLSGSGSTFFALLDGGEVPPLFSSPKAGRPGRGSWIVESCAGIRTVSPAR